MNCSTTKKMALDAAQRAATANAAEGDLAKSQAAGRRLTRACLAPNG